MQVSLTVTPHPVTLDGQRHLSVQLDAGDTLDSLLRRHVEGVDPLCWVAAIGGREVAPEMWAHTRPAAGTVIECRRVPKKKFLAIAIPIALSIYAPGFGASAFGAGTFAAKAFAAAIVVAGTMLVNKILGPAIPKGQRSEQASPTYALSGGRNRARPYEPIPLLFGELRYTPDYASVPYTVIEGEDQYLYSVFHAGINCGSVSDIRIGKTSLASYSGVTTRSAGISEMADQALDAWGNVDTAAGATIIGGGAYVERTSSAGAQTLQIDIEGTLYDIRKSKGTFQPFDVVIEADYRVAGSGGAWLPFFGATNSVTITNASTKPVRRTYTLEVATGQYEVRVRKISADENSTEKNSNFVWTSLRTVQADTGTYSGMGRYSIKIKASGQLNGALDELTWQATAKPMPYWDGSAWVTATTRATGLSNPGAQMLLYARGIYDDDGKLIAGMGLDDSQINVDALAEFMVWCAAHDFTFDAVFDSAVSHAEVLDAIAAVGFGAHTWAGGKLGVTWAADDQPIEGVVNMATMRAKSFQVRYQTVETADSIEFQYFDRDRDYAWKTLLVMGPEATTSLNPARISSVGITSEAHAAIMARFHMAQSLYQRKDIAYETDLEHLTYQRNSVLALSHDVTQWGYGGRVQAAADVAGVITLTLDDYVPSDATARFIGLRIPGERGYRVFAVDAFTGPSNTLTLTDAWPSGVPFPGTAGNPAHDTIWIYDFKATPGQKVRVISVQPQAGLAGASVAVVPELAEFWDYVWSGDYTPPVSQSLLPFSLPTVTGLSVSEELRRQGNGYYVELTAVWSATGAYRNAQIWGATAGNALQKLGETQDLRFSWRANLDEVWSIEVRPFGTLGRPGTIASASYRVEGLSVSPDAPTAVTSTPTHLFFTPSAALDIAGYLVRYNVGTDTEWSVGTPLHAVTDGYAGGLVSGSPWPMPQRLYGINTVMVKAVDTSGNESVAAYETRDFGTPDAANVADTDDYAAAGFPGTITDGTVSGTDLLADVDPSVDFYGSGAGEDFWYRDGAADLWGGSQYLAMTYVATYTPPYDGGTVFIDATIAGSRPTISYREDPADAWKPWAGSYGLTTASAAIYFQITTDAGPVRGVIDVFTVRLEMPSLEQVFSNVSISSSGTTLAPSAGAPARIWIAIEDVQITPVVDGSGAVAGRLKSAPSPSAGPDIELLNISGTAVTGHAFVRVRGY